MRIALLTYRGNMYCGGQGIYAAALAREWQRAGHEVHVIAGPPLPALAPGIPLHVVENENVFGLTLREWAQTAPAGAANTLDAALSASAPNADATGGTHADAASEASAPGAYAVVERAVSHGAGARTLDATRGLQTPAHAASARALRDPRRLLSPLTLWEFGVSRIGVFPEMHSFGLRLLLRWRQLQQRHRFDVVFDNQSLSWPLLALRRLGAPVVSVIHHPLHIDRAADFAMDARLSKRLKRTLYFPLLMQQFVARRLDRIVTVSEASRAEIERCFGIPAKDISVVPNGTDAEVFRPHPEVKKRADLIFVGRTEDRKKGIGTLLEALALLPERVTLHIVDGRIPADGLVPREIARLGLAGRVSFQERFLELPELVREYARGRVAVVPSFFEGFGFPASEAMACGLPVVANATGALPEVVGSDGRAGVLTPPKNPRALADAIMPLLENPARAAQMGARARRRVQQTFRWERAAESLLQVFEETRRAAHRQSRPA